jgi:hypothetical protein
MSLSCKCLLLEGDVRAKVVQLAPDIRHSKPFVVSPIGDSAVTLGWIAVHIYAIPMLGMSDVMDACVVGTYRACCRTWRFLTSLTRPASLLVLGRTHQMPIRSIKHRIG